MKQHHRLSPLRHTLSFAPLLVFVVVLSIRCSQVVPWENRTIIGGEQTSIAKEQQQQYLHKKNVARPSKEELRRIDYLLNHSLPTNPYEKKNPDPTDYAFSEYAQALKDRLTNQEYYAIESFVETLTHVHCRSDQHARRSLLHFLHNHSQSEAWIHPANGIVRSAHQESLVPCGGDKSSAPSFWVEDGNWNALPMLNHCCHHGTAILKCPGPFQKACPPGSSFSDAPWVCPAFVGNGKDDECLVYSFGIADQWDIEDYLATQHGCRVHAFDPTTKYKELHEKHTSGSVEGVTFHFQGLSTGDMETASAHKVETHYGAMDGEFHSLGQLWKEHSAWSSGKRRMITVLKIDCEGCEWESLHHIATEEPEVLTNVCTIFMEMHLSNLLQMKTPQQLKYLASFWQHYILKLGFRFWFWHPNPGAVRDRKINPLLIELGLDPRVCCYEIALYRPGCAVAG